MIKGIDISHLNQVNWNKLDPQVKFVWHKVSQGAIFDDPLFNDRWQYLKTTSLYRGGYHFLTVNSSAQDQADLFLKAGIDFSLPNVLPPMLDIEDQVSPIGDSHATEQLNIMVTKNTAAFVKLATDWINIVESKTGRKVVIYSYKNFLSETLKGAYWPNNPLWLAAYQPAAPGLPVGYNSFAFWQYAQYGTIDGRFTYDAKEAKAMGATLDLDYFNGTMADLMKL